MPNRHLRQLKDPQALVRGWSVEHPRFYGVATTDDFVDALISTEGSLRAGSTAGLDPWLCRVLAAYHGPKGAKVPLAAQTVSGCVRPAFVAINPAMCPGGDSCYGGGCYLYHARAVPGKKASEVKVRPHRTPREGLLAAARLARKYGLAIRDNQSSDGSLSMTLLLPGKNTTQLRQNLDWLTENGYQDVNYLCFSSCYVEVEDKILRQLGTAPQVVVHVTVSGWHSKEENLLRLGDFERYAQYIQHCYLRIVNRQDWHTSNGSAIDEAAGSEAWLLNEIVRRGLHGRVIRTPYHSVHPFPGSATASLGSRHMAGDGYTPAWRQFRAAGARDCCLTGKCKTCPTACGASRVPRSLQEPLIAARAMEAMCLFERKRQGKEGLSPLAVYTARMLARKSAEAYTAAGDSVGRDRMKSFQQEFAHMAGQAQLSPLQRRRLANDSHALVVDGMDRHGLWRNHPRCQVASQYGQQV